MNKSFALLLAVLGGAIVLLGMLLHGSDGVQASGLLARTAQDPVEAPQPSAAPFLAHLTTLGVLDEAWQGGESELQRVSGLDERRLEPLVDVAMDWSLPQREWHAKLLTLFDARLIDGLRDDDVKWNATATARVLRDRLRSESYAVETRLALERAFQARDVDEQEQRLCAGLLQVHGMRGLDHDPHEPIDALLDYSVDSMGCWSNWGGDYWIASSTSGRQTLKFALAHLDRMAPRIASALRERGPNDSFVHAYLLGKGSYAEYAHLSSPILVAHLRDNQHEEDALMSLEALRALGEKASPWLWSTLRRSDVQQEYCIRLLLEEAGTLAMNPESVAAQKEPLTWKVEDPVRSWTFLENSRR